MIEELEEQEAGFMVYVEHWPVFGISTETAFPEICEYIRTCEIEKEFGDTKILRRRQRTIP
jgi:hypothetical protein